MLFRSLFYNPLISTNKFVKLKYDETTKNMKYENLDAPANDFTDLQQRDIDVLVNFVLPFIVSPNTGAIVGPEIIKELEVIGAGSFGVTVAYKGLLIKILKVDALTAGAVANELHVSNVLFKDEKGSRYVNIPRSINQIHGMITGNKMLWDKIRGHQQLDQAANRLHLFNNLGIFDLAKFTEAVSVLKSDVNHFLQGHIAALFLDKATMSMTSFKKGFGELSLLDKALCISKFYDDMYTALHYIHFTRGYIHNDIKPDNIVLYLGPRTIDTYYQLIDFGLLSKINNVDLPQTRQGGTRVFTQGTVYEKNSNIFYDWHCVLLSALYLLGLVEFGGGKFVYVSNKKDIYDIDHEGLKNMLRAHFTKIIDEKNIARTDELIKELNKIVVAMVTNRRLYEASEAMVNGLKVNAAHYIGVMHNAIYPERVLSTKPNWGF